MKPEQAKSEIIKNLDAIAAALKAGADVIIKTGKDESIKIIKADYKKLNKQD